LTILPPLRPPDASLAIPPRVHWHRSFNSRHARIPYPPVEPLLFVLWLNQVTRRFCVELPPTPCADSCCEPLPCIGSGRRLCLAFLATMRRTLDPVRPPGPSSWRNTIYSSRVSRQTIHPDCFPFLYSMVASISLLWLE
jgi:hypothetical protein